MVVYQVVVEKQYQGDPAGLEDFAFTSLLLMLWRTKCSGSYPLSNECMFYGLWSSITCS
jgi:hypothetical protein